MTISYAIGRNSTEGRTHTMCIEGTHGTMVGMGARHVSSLNPAWMATAGRVWLELTQAWGWPS